MGCAIPTTETGLALDHDRSRLFIAHLRDPNNPEDAPGFLSTWDVSDPLTPTEVGTRTDLDLYPNRMSVH